jgi:hypothetical protein
MTDTAELIARADALLTVRRAGKSHLPESPWDLMQALRDGYAAQVLEIERLRIERDSFQASMCVARRQIIDGDERGNRLIAMRERAEAAERKIEVQEMAMETARNIWEQKLAANFAATKERCATVADRLDSVNGIGAAIRALKAEP